VEEHFPNGSTYKGEKRNQLRHGRGRFTYSDGAFYEGQWKENMIHG